MTPRLPHWLLRKRLPAERSDIHGDLEEAYRRDILNKGRLIAGLRYWKDALAISIRLPRELARASTMPESIAASLRPPRRLALFSRSDLILAVRRARKQPVMTLTSILALGVGIGLPTGGYSVFQQVMYSKLPFANGERFVQINTRDAESGSPASVSVAQVRAFRDGARAFQYVGGLSVSPLNVVLDDGTVERVPSARLTPGLMAALPYAPIAGRLFSSNDGITGSEPVVIIRERYWEKTFARNPDAIGSQLNIVGARHTIVGVLPEAAGFPDNGDLWLPLDEQTLGAGNDETPVPARLVGVLANDADITLAERQLSQLQRQHSMATGSDSARVFVRPFTEQSFGPQLQTLMAMTMLILTVVLLVIAANVANLVSVSTSRRSAELAVRRALGANRSRLVAQILAEVMFVGLLGAALGLTITGVILRFYNTVLDEKPYWMYFSFTWQTVLAALLLTILACLVMGLPPALRATAGNAGEKMKGAGRGGALGVGRVGGFMIAFEVALSVALLGTAVQFARAFDRFANPVPGIAEDRVVTAQIYAELPADEALAGTPLAATVRRDSIRALSAAIREQLRQLPWVDEATVASNVPRSLPRAQPVVVEKSKANALASVAEVSGQFLEVLSVRQSAGRFINDSDLLPGAPLVAVVNEAFADANFGTRAIVGERIQLSSDAVGDEPVPWREIVGVVPNVMDVTDPDEGQGIYTPLGASPLMSVAVRVRTNPLDHINNLRAALFEVDPALNVSRVVPLNKVNIEDVQATQVMSSSLAGIAVVTMLLALAGIYSIVSLAVTQRTREIGVRVALGADKRQIVTSILRRSGTLIFAGAIVGAVLGALGGSVKMFVFTIPEQSLFLQPTMVFLVVIAGALACVVPTRRALRIQPVEALRYEE